MTIQAVLTDLQRDEGGWCANGCSVDRETIELPDDASDATIIRRIKSALGIQGWRRDSWAGADYCWRDGSMGAYADIVD